MTLQNEKQNLELRVERLARLESKFVAAGSAPSTNVGSS